MDDDRVKTDLRFPRHTWQACHEVAQYLGITLNGVLTLAALKFSLEMLQLLPSRKRLPILEKLDRQWAKDIADLKKRVDLRS